MLNSEHTHVNPRSQRKENTEKVANALSMLPNYTESLTEKDVTLGVAGRSRWDWMQQGPSELSRQHWQGWG